MHIKHLLMTMAMVAAVSTAAMAEGTAAAPAAPDNKAQHEQKFEERKAEILKHMSEHIANIQKRQSCVQAAADHEALKACMPERGKYGHHGQGDHDEKHDPEAAPK